MKTLKILVLFMLGFALSAYRNYTKPNTLYQYHAVKLKSDDIAKCGVVDKPSKKSEVYLFGKQLFKNNCASCHNKDMKTPMTGPALGNTFENWSDYPKEDLYNWIRNSQKMISEGHPRATELWSEWKVEMAAFPNLSDKDIEAILKYVGE